ncbi:MAG: sigma factor [Bryobacteraceae bacterium]|nr:sigma factor [Bryobacteraceae bacterium]
MERTDMLDQNRRYLFGLAYQMVGSAADAEDLVRDCWLRWRGRRIRQSWLNR